MDTEAQLGAQGITILRRTAALLAIAGLVATVNNTTSIGFQSLSFGGRMASVFGIAAYVMLVRGHHAAAVRVLIWGTGTVLIGFTFVTAGVRTPSLIFLPILCMAAAWLINIRHAIVLGSMGLAAIAFFLVAEAVGLQLPTTPRNSLSYALMYLFTLIGAVIVALGSTRSFQAQLQRTLDLSKDLQRQVLELRRSEERFSALFRANPVPSSTIDREGRIIDVNDAWLAVYGVTKQAALGKTTVELGAWNEPDERKAVYQEMEQRGRVDGARMTLRTSTGASRPFLLYIAPVEFDGQQRLVTSLLDQSDREAAEAAQRAIHVELEQRVAERTAELTHMLQTLQATQTELVEAEKLASLGAMVAGISHELNTPLGVAITAASTLHGRARELQDTIAKDQLRRSTLTDYLAGQRDMTDLILRSTERAAELVRSFRELAVDRASERRRRFNLAGLVQDIVTAIQPGMDNPGITLTLEVDPGIVCDSLPGPIGQVLTNLVQNAVVHAFGGQASGSIRIHAGLQGHGTDTQVVLRVTDDGVGMSEHVRRHAFDPFFTTRLGQGGSGLGLSVSHRLATAMLGGSLTVDSAPGEGSRFTFCFLQNLPG